MNIGEKLLKLRKEKKLSQEEVAEILKVSRQTISKWETNQSTPDLDKIIPLCNLYNITSDELLNTKQPLKETQSVLENSKTKAKKISQGIFLYFISIVYIMLSVLVFKINPIISSAIFLLICAIATYLIIYTCLVYKKPSFKETNKIVKEINRLIALIILIIYLIISFLYKAWHITWILWLIYALITQIVKLIYMLRGDKNAK